MHTHTAVHMMKSVTFPPSHVFLSKCYKVHNGYYVFLCNQKYLCRAHLNIIEMLQEHFQV